jgi:2-polyprenyl-6-methoxyphenol hydroxylase-like FAD-dependent oxidoreductase
MSLRVAIVGAGPMGLCAALGCLRRGLQPIVLEAAPHVGASLRAFGPTRFFTRSR